MDNHEEKLMKRIQSRKLKTMTSKSGSDALFMNSSEKDDEGTKNYSVEKKTFR